MFIEADGGRAKIACNNFLFLHARSDLKYPQGIGLVLIQKTMDLIAWQ